MTISFISNEGPGVARDIEIQPGTTVEIFLSRQLPGRDPAEFLVRVNRQRPAPGQLLAPGDRICITPTAVAAAL